MKNLMSVLLLSGLICSPSSQAKTPAKPAQPKCAQGKLVGTFDDKGPTKRDYHHYRCLLKQDQNGYLVQDFYWPSGKKQTDPIIIDKTGLKKNALRDGTGNTSGADGLLVLWYESGQKQAEMTFVAGKANGQFTNWYENGQKRTEGQIFADKETGAWTTWYENGQKKMTGQYVDGQKTGLWTTWDVQGKKWKEGEYRADERSGVWTTWYGNGQKKTVTYFVKGDKTGLETTWYENGQMASVGQRQDGGQVGQWTFWKENGQQDRAGLLDLGRPTGLWSVWQADGGKTEHCYSDGEEITPFRKGENGQCSPVGAEADQSAASADKPRAKYDDTSVFFMNISAAWLPWQLPVCVTAYPDLRSAADEMLGTFELSPKTGGLVETAQRSGCFKTSRLSHDQCHDIIDLHRRLLKEENAITPRAHEVEMSYLKLTGQTKQALESDLASCPELLSEGSDE